VLFYSARSGGGEGPWVLEVEGELDGETRGESLGVMLGDSEAGLLSLETLPSLVLLELTVLVLVLVEFERGKKT